MQRAKVVSRTVVTSSEPNHLSVDPFDCTVLVVDDEPKHLELVQHILTRDGYRRVEAAASGEEALLIWRRMRPHVLLLDLNMAGLDGWAVLDRLRGELEEHGTAVVVLTADGNPATRKRALSGGARDFIAKPFDPYELLARVRNAAEVQELGRRLRGEKERVEAAVRARTTRLEGAIELLRQAEATLTHKFERADGESRAKDGMLVEAAHDLRSPLNAICGFAEIIRDERMGPVGTERYRDYAREIHQAARHVLAVIGDVLDLSRAKAGEEKLNLRQVSVGDVVRSSVELMRLQAEQAGIKLSVKMPSTPLHIQTDETKLRRIIINMTSNAVKFTPRGGSVSVEVNEDREGGAFVLVIRDNGVGIAAEDMATALRPFGRVRRDGQNAEGTGLGMPLTKALVEALGGTFEVLSDRGHGTSIRIRLRQTPDGKASVASGPPRYDGALKTAIRNNAAARRNSG